MTFKSNFHKFLAIFFCVFVMGSGLLIFFRAYPDNFVLTASDKVLRYTLESTSWVQDSFDGFIQEIKISREANDKIEQLNDEINKLREMLVDYQNLKSENERLTNFCGVKNEYPEMNFVNASVLKPMIVSLNNNIVIDIGTDNGVSRNDAVLTEKGFVGRVAWAGKTVSVVKTILSPDINVGVIDQNTQNIGVIAGSSDLAGNNLTKMSLIRYRDSVNVSDILTTSGLSGLYPRNLKVGSVKSVEYDSYNSSYYAVVEPFENINEVKNVFVITNFPGKSIIDYFENP